MTDYSPAVTLLSHQMEARTKVRSNFREEAGALLDAHQLAFSAVAQMANRFSGRRFKQQPRSMESRMSLTAHFVQGVDTCETTISEGLYSQAAALLKQEMETIEAVRESEEGSRKEGRTPQLGKLKAFGRLYGHFNEFAHVSRENIANSIVSLRIGELCGPSIIPLYEPNVAKYCYGMHTYFITVSAGQIHSIFLEVFGDGMHDEEAKWVFASLDILIREGIITPQDPAAWSKLGLLTQKQ